jgi:RNA polymerase sigma factor (TIGR02999 family)
MLAAMAGSEQHDSEGLDRLLPGAYAELRGIADFLLRQQGSSATLQPTELLHEAFLRLRGAATPVQLQDERHFRRVAARAMRYVLVDRARARVADKRGNGRARVTLDDDVAVLLGDCDRVLRVHEGLERLRAVDAQLAELVELRFFGGLGIDEIADALGTSSRTIDRQWRLVRAWWIANESGTDDA